MSRFIVDRIHSNTGEITGQDARHISRVLRLKPGDSLDISDGKGNGFEAQIQSISASKVTLRILNQQPGLLESSCRITLCTGMLKDKKMDTVLRHVTELGITEWQPFYCDRSVPVHDEKRKTARVNRWQTIAKEALKQCMRSRLPIIHPPVDFPDILDRADRFDFKFIFWESQENSPVPGSDTAAQEDRQIMIVIGPEGGLSSKEINAAKDAGFTVLSMGPRILRAQTAAISACTLIQHRFGDM